MLLDSYLISIVCMMNTVHTTLMIMSTHCVFLYVHRYIHTKLIMRIKIYASIY